MRPHVLADLEPALGWLRDSGIQEPAGSAEAGGVHAWIDERTGERAFLYSEITGYFMTLCTQIAKVDPGGGWLGRAEAAAGWIVERALHESGAVLCRKHDAGAPSADDPYSFERGLVPFFDCAMVGFGLLCTYRATADRRWLEAARRIGNFVRGAFGPRGVDPARPGSFDVRAGALAAAGPRWSQHFGPFECKGALFLDALATATGESANREWLDEIVAGTVRAQQPSGRFPTSSSGASTHLHPHCYTIEGLLYLAARHRRRDLLDRALLAIDWMFRTCLAIDAPMHQWAEPGSASPPDVVIPKLRSDTLAQALRAYRVAKLLEPTAAWPWEQRVPALEALLATFALGSGGTGYGQDEHGPKPGHANAWCHFFRVEMLLFRGLAADDFDPSALVLT